MGYDNRTVIASASNAKYNEIAFSSAEDFISSQEPYFGGEVALGSRTLVTTPVHTGKTALQLETGGGPGNPTDPVYGFIFKSSEITPSKTYRASVWANNTSGRIYYKLGANGTEVCPTPVISAAVAIPGMG